MNEKQIEQIFHKQTKKLVKSIGNHALSNHELDAIGPRLFGNKYHGTYSQDKIQYKNGFCIINVDVHSKKGSHWVALYITSRTIYVFDSFGRPTPKLLKVLTTKAKKLNKRLVDCDYDRNQKYDSIICGHMCLSWLACVRDHGIKTALKI